MRCPPIGLRNLEQENRVSRVLPHGPIALAMVLTLCLLPLLVHALIKAKPPKTETLGNHEARLARLSEAVTVHAAGRGNPTINLSDGRDVLTSYVGPQELRVALEQNQAEPMSLASADFDEDGVPDLVSGYAYNGQGIVSLLRGNVDSIYPNAPEAKQRKAEGTFTDAPFLSPAEVFPAPAAADFIGAGDFDGDGHWDVVVASRTRNSLFLLSGDGHGGFAAAQEFDLPGRVTAMTTGEINRADGLTDIVVGVAGANGSYVMVFEGPEGALRSSAEIYSAPATVTAIALAELGGDHSIDLAVAAGRDLMLVQGRDRKLSLNAQQRLTVSAPTIEHRTFDFSIRSLAIGNFIGNAKSDIALLSESGEVRLVHSDTTVTKRSGAKQSFASWITERQSAAQWPGASQLFSAHLSADPLDDLLTIDSSNRKVRVLTRARSNDSGLAAPREFNVNQTQPREVLLDVDGSPVALLPIKLNGDAVSDLVVMRSDKAASSIILSAPSAIITVNSTADTNVRDNIITLREAILLSNGELLKSALTPAEQSQVNGTPAPGLDEVRFDIPAGALAPIDPSASQPRKRDDEAAKSALVRSYSSMPMSFELNEGQHDSSVKFLARGGGYNLFLTSNEAVLSLRAPDKAGQKKSVPNPMERLVSKESERQQVVRVKLEDANTQPRVTGLEELPGRINYFIGNDHSKWRTDIPTYAKVKYEQVYPGVDLVYYGSQGQLEYDLVVAPGADPNVIKISYDGIQRKSIDRDGNLVLNTPGGKIVQHKPLVYQETANGRREIEGRYRLKRAAVKFEVDDYDRTQPLVIDPVLRYSTYFGGGGGDYFYAVAVDGDNNAYVAGFTASAELPTRDPFQATFGGGGNDVVISKFHATNNNIPTLAYSTFLGGNGPVNEYGTGIALDASGNIYVAGLTDSTNFPTLNAFQPNYGGGLADAFLAKLNPSGSALIFSTYLGGSGEEFSPFGNGGTLALDSSGNAHVVGITKSTDFPVQNALQPTYGGGVQDGFVAKFDPTGARIYSTYLGGSVEDGAHGVAIDPSGNACITGSTNSTNFLTVNPFQANLAQDGFGGFDVFVTKLNPSGATIFSTYLGGLGSDIGDAITVDALGNIYIAGSADANFPRPANSLSFAHSGDIDAFVAKLNPTGSTLLYTTFLGGNDLEYALAIAVDGSGNAYVAGKTTSSDFPVFNAYQAAKAGPPAPVTAAWDAFVVKLNPTGTSLLYSTYFGGTEFDAAFGIALDQAGTAYVVGNAGSNFPLVRQLQTTYGTNGDAFIAKFALFSLTGPDLDLAKTHSGNFSVGLSGTYNFTLRNGGTAASSGTITVTDNLPAGLEFVSAGGAGWNCAAVGQTVTCTYNDPIPVNGSAAFSMTVNVGYAAVPRTVNIAALSNASDTNLTNNSAMDTTGVIVDCVNPRPMSVGQTINFALTTQSCRSPIRGPQTYSDRYRFNGTAGQGVALTMTSPPNSVIPYLYLIGPNNSVLDETGDGSHLARIPFTTGFFTLPVTGQYVIEATTGGFNQTGTYTLSLTSGTAGCSYDIAPTSQSFPTLGGIGNVAVTALAGCEWMAVSNANFITINSPNGAQNGNGTVTYTVAPNNSGAVRTGTMTIAGQTFTVTQNFGCSYSISPTSQSFGNTAGTGSITVTADAGCAWTAVSNDSFVHVNSGGNGTGNGSVGYSVDQNNSGNARTGTITVAGQTFTVIQGTTSADARTITLLSPLPRITDPISIDGATQPGFLGTPLIEINGINLRNNGGGNGLDITAGSSTIRSLIVNRFSSSNRDSAILLITNGNNVIEGCYIGPNSSGTQGFQPSGPDALSNGVSMRSSSNNRVGGSTTAARNLVSGIDGNGVSISGGSTANLVQGNFIGVDVTGSASLGFQRIGVFIQNASGNSIGGETLTPGTPPGNVISGNIDFGILMLDVANNNLVVGNLIGSNGNGTVAVPNRNAGVFIYNPSELGGQLNNTIGGTTTAARNVISGNNPYGIVLGEGATGTQVQGNYIGTKASGSAALPNTYGITATQATGSTIGGVVDGARNVISGNNLTGISIGFLNNGKLGGTGTTIQRNYIGTNFNATGPLANQADGIFVEVQSITHTVSENVIAFNGNSGVRIPNVTANPGTPAFRIQIVDNSIFSNSALGIDLGTAGVTPNKTGGPFPGEANLHQNFPVLTSVTAAAPGDGSKPRGDNPDVTVTVNGTLNSTPSTAFTVHWYFSVDAQCITNQQTSKPLVTGKVPGVTTDNNGNAAFFFPLPLPVGINSGIVNCTATDPQGNTSEFSFCLPVNPSPTPTPTPTPTPQGFTPVGSNVSVSLPPVDIMFAQVGTAGTTTANGIAPASAGTVPGGYVINGSSVAFDISTTAVYTPPVDVCITLSSVTDVNVFNSLSVLHNEGGTLVDRTNSRDFATKKICARVTSLSPFAVASRIAVQFSSATYAISEAGPRIDVTVTRSGDTSSAAAVNFVTNDNAGLTNCNVFNGIASPRCDYTNTGGTLQWAAGDASPKSFSVAIVDDAYAEGNETFTVSLSSPSGATLGTQANATVTINDNDSTNGANPIDNTNFFVRQQYIDFLGREPDPPGLAGWAGTINNCSGDTTQCDRIHVSQLFFQSAEFQERGYFVYRFYPVAFGRKPDYSEFVVDLARVSGFLDANQLEAAKVQFITDFMARSAFANTYNPLNNTQYVDALLNTAGVTLSTRQTMINGLNGSTMTRAQVLRQIVESTEVSKKYNHQAYAVMEYFGYLRRQPDGFYLQWIADLDLNNNPRGMVTGFVTSAEYRFRFGP